MTTDGEKNALRDSLVHQARRVFVERLELVVRLKLQGSSLVVTLRTCAA